MVGRIGDTPVTWALVLALSLALSAAAYHWVEHPLERWLRRVGPGVGQAPACRYPAQSDGVPGNSSRSARTDVRSAAAERAQCRPSASDKDA